MTRSDSVEFLDSEEAIVAYLQAAAEEGDSKFYLKCLSKAMRACAINQLAEATGIDRDQIYETFSDSTTPDPVIVAKIQAVLATAVSKKVMALV